MARTIEILPDSVANQIAAGEVVERPSSVVKELVENALDASARTVKVRIEQGGKRTIRVSDDGVGMSREDSLLCLDRHATSKIRSADQLRNVKTLGFRGEALPSIASVSRLTIETCARGEELGTRIQARGGSITSIDDFARTPGTTVEVDTLFYNAPARSKFLSSPSAETRAVSDAIVPLAIANPSVGFTLVSGERTLFDLAPTGDVGERVAELWGRDAAAELIPVGGDAEEYSVRGFVQRPDATRPGFRRTFLFLGRRPFREAALLRAADRAYRTTIPEKNRPWVILFLEIPGGGADVNVHPTKAEVRFRKLGAVEALVEGAVRHALEGEASAATFDRPESAVPLVVREREPEPSSPEKGGPARPSPGQMALFLSREDSEASALSSASSVPGSRDRLDADRAQGPGDQGSRLVGDGGVRLWQVHHAWILAEVRDGLLLIDQHAAHERVLFERIMRRMEVGGETSQHLLFPLTVRLSPAEAEVVGGIRGLLRSTGFDVEGFGGDTIIVRAVPSPHPYFDAERCLREMIAELNEGSELMRSARNQNERVAMSFACKAAIKAGQKLDDSEVQELFDQLFATELPYHDVHGRPTTVRLSIGELERKFGR